MEARMMHPRIILGSGQEGIVWREGTFVTKRFFDEKPSEAKVAWLRSTLIQTFPHLPEPVWEKEGATWCARYRWFESEDVQTLDLEELRPFFGSVSSEASLPQTSNGRTSSVAN